MSNLKWQKRPGEPFGFAAEFKRSDGTHYDHADWQFFIEVFNRFGMLNRIELIPAEDIDGGPWYTFSIDSDSTKGYTGTSLVNTVRKNRISGDELFDVYGTVEWISPKVVTIAATLETGPASVTINVNEVDNFVSVIVDTAILPIYNQSLLADIEQMRDHLDNTSNPHGVTAAQVGAYTRVPVASYAAALAQATGTTPKIFIVAADETDGGNTNYYYYEGTPGVLTLQF